MHIFWFPLPLSIENIYVSFGREFYTNMLSTLWFVLSPQGVYETVEAYYSSVTSDGNSVYYLFR
jgi:hypothetical protein